MATLSAHAVGVAAPVRVRVATSGRTGSQVAPALPQTRRPLRCFTAAVASAASTRRSGGGCARRSVGVAAKRCSVVAAAAADTAPVDWAAYGRYVGGAGVELGLQALAMFLLDRYVLPLLPANAQVGCVAAWFLFNSFSSRVFSPLDSRRPTLQSEKDAIQSRRRPAWMPPPIAFPIVWSTIGVLRTVSSTLVWLATGRQLLCLPLLAFQLHLCIGDSWNFANNQEQRLGVAVPGVAAVWASAVATTVLYGQVSTTAAWVLLPLPIWLTIASVLVYDIWRLNGGAERYPLWPTVGSAANEKK